MVQFVHHEGNCLVGNTTDLKLYSALCNVSDRNQRFAFTGPHSSPGFLKMNPERENKITYCIAANCTVSLPPTPRQVFGCMCV